MTGPGNHAQQGRIVALAAGGTGGHMFPAQALARELLSRGSRVRPDHGPAPAAASAPTCPRSRPSGSTPGPWPAAACSRS